MPLHDVGYRRWSGPRTSPQSRWRVIAEGGVGLAWRVPALRRMLLTAWVPALVAGALFLAFERAITEDAVRFGLLRFVSNLPGSAEVAVALATPADQGRWRFWSYMLMTFFRYPQGALMVVVVGLVAPALISRDIRSRAFLLYFSRPIDRMQYLLGKAMVVWTYLATIATLPALAIYVVGVLMSPSVWVVLDTWDLPLRIMAASLVLMIPTTALALCLSSLASESRYAMFGWFLFWILGWFAYSNLTAADAAQRFAVGDQPGGLLLGATMFPGQRWTLVSPYHMLGKVQALVFGLERWNGPWVLPSMLVLLTLTVVSVTITYRRISAPMRI